MEPGKPARFQFAKFTNVWVSSGGIIVSRETCQAVSNGACHSIEDFVIPKDSVPVYNQVVSIANRWGDQVFHFPMECLAGLSGLDSSLIKESKIHVTSKTKWTLSWLELAGIGDDQVVDGTVHARKLIAPRLAQCGEPFRDQLDYVSSLVPSVDESDEFMNPILYVKRSSRTVGDGEGIEHAIRDWARLLNITMIVHDDKNLPPLSEQLRLFQRAAVVVSPHGAALSLLVASRPGTCVVEFVDPEYTNHCFMRIAYLRRLVYSAVSMAGGNVEMDKLEEALWRCTSEQQPRGSS